MPEENPPADDIIVGDYDSAAPPADPLNENTAMSSADLPSEKSAGSLDLRDEMDIPADRGDVRLVGLPGQGAGIPSDVNETESTCVAADAKIMTISAENSDSDSTVGTNDVKAEADNIYGALVDKEIAAGGPSPLSGSGRAATGPDSAGEEAVRFKRLKLSHRSYRGYEDGTAGKEEDVEMVATTTIVPEAKPDADNPPLPALEQLRNEYTDTMSSESSEDDTETVRAVRARRIVRAEDLDEDSSDTSSDDSDDEGQMRRHHSGGDHQPEDTDSQESRDGDVETQAEARRVLQKPLPKPRYNLSKDLMNRQLGRRMVPRFTDRFIASPDTIKRFEIRNKLHGHDGCVNALHFNSTGSKIASGSDDLSIIIWDWEKEQKLLSFNTGHKANVFQSKFMPGDLLVTSCSRDGQVRLAELSVTGSLRSTKKLVQHSAPVHKLALVPWDQTLVLSAGEDGQVIAIDLREEKPQKLLHLKNQKDKQIPIYSIHTNPGNSWEFCTAGRDPYMRIFDRRCLAKANTDPVSKFCPEELEKSDTITSYLTSAVFSHDGSEILGSYNDDDIYLFPTAAGRDGVKRYRGHRNSATVKGVNFYGPQSEYVISGSDCGNIFFWSKETEAILNILPGDEKGVVNVLEQHPTLPVLATSGLDDDVKVWMPTLPTEGPESARIAKNKALYISKTVHMNLADQSRTRGGADTDSLDGQMLWDLLRHLRYARRRHRRREGASGNQEREDTDDDDDVEDEEDEDEDDEEGSDAGSGPRGVGCVQS